MRFPPVWVNKGALGGSEAGSSSHLPQTLPRGATRCVCSYFQSILVKLNNFAKKAIQTNKKNEASLGKKERTEDILW